MVRLKAQLASIIHKISFIKPALWPLRVSPSREIYKYTHLRSPHCSGGALSAPKNMLLATKASARTHAAYTPQRMETHAVSMFRLFRHQYSRNSSSTHNEILQGTAQHLCVMSEKVKTFNVLKRPHSSLPPQ